MHLNDIFQNTSYGDSLFTADKIAAVEARISIREVKGKTTPYITCLVRNKELRLTPEEVGHQLYIYELAQNGRTNSKAGSGVIFPLLELFGNRENDSHFCGS